MKRIFALLLTFSMLIMLVGCAAENRNDTGEDEKRSDVTHKAQNGLTDLMRDIRAGSISIQPDISVGTDAITDFSSALVQNCFKNGENLLISPLSVLSALAMTANGAEAETRAQMEDVFGLSVEELNAYLHWYVDSLPQGENYRLNIANSIWFTQDTRFTPRQEFLQCNADYYGADIYSAPFDDTTLKDINQWVEKKTDGMIDTILDRIPEETVMYLVNALAFEARWNKMYEDYQVRSGIFTKEDGTEQTVDLMYGQEYRYLEDELTTGFIKHYEDRSYAFVALLPREGLSIEEYIATLTGERIRNLLENGQNTMVVTAMPQFETEYSVEMAEVLFHMGMKDAFDLNTADFSRLGTSEKGNLYISRVLHKTFISVTQQGTRAGAATVVEMPDATGMPPEDLKEVYLDRPFVYLLIDCENNLPFFIGVLTDTEK